MPVTTQIAKYFVKPNKFLFINKKFHEPENFVLKLTGELDPIALLKDKKNIIPDVQTKALMGEGSLWAESLLQSQFGEATTQIKLMFGYLPSVKNISCRAKGAPSIEPRLLRFANEAEDFTLHNMDEVMAAVDDGIGSRIIINSLKKLSNSEITNMINSMTIEGKKLTNRQKFLLDKFIYEKPIGKQKDYDEAFELFEHFTNPLVEKRSQETVNQLLLGIFQQRINTGEITLKEIEDMKLLNPAMLERLKAGDHLPIDITEIRNYRGEYGIAEFTKAQIADLDLALNYGKTPSERVGIISDLKGIKNKWGDDIIADSKAADKIRSKAIKASGYRTAQMKMKYLNGAYGELQCRGVYTNMIGEYEHVAYDLRNGKDTCSEIFNEYKKAITKLTDQEYDVYNKYLESCYNYYNRLELGLPAKKPKLPTMFNKVLSEDNMRKLHFEDVEFQKRLGRNFSRHIEAAA